MAFLEIQLKLSQGLEHVLLLVSGSVEFSEILHELSQGLEHALLLDSIPWRFEAFGLDHNDCRFDCSGDCRVG